MRLIILLSFFMFSFGAYGAAVVPLRPGAGEMSYTVIYRMDDQRQILELLVPALSLVKEFPPPGFSIRDGSAAQFDFAIHVTDTERVRFENESPRAVLSSSNIAYTMATWKPGKYVVRLLWDQIAMFKMENGIARPNPDAFPNLLAVLAREIYGNLREFTMRRPQDLQLGDDAVERRNAYRESVEFFRRLMNHPKFNALSEIDQRGIREALIREERVWVSWQHLLEERTRRVRPESETTAPTILKFPNRCERMFSSTM